MSRPCGRDAADAETRTAQAVESGARAVVAMGGDGIVHHVAQGLVETDAASASSRWDHERHRPAARGPRQAGEGRSSHRRRSRPILTMGTADDA